VELELELSGFLAAASSHPSRPERDISLEKVNHELLDTLCAQVETLIKREGISTPALDQEVHAILQANLTATFPHVIFPQLPAHVKPNIALNDGGYCRGSE